MLCRRCRNPILDGINLYTYVGNDPLDKTDATGQTIEYTADAPQDFKDNFGAAIKDLNAAGAAKGFASMQKSSDKFFVGPAADRGNGFQTQYSSTTKTVTWADKSGLTVTDSKTGKPATMSPEMSLGHEGQHAQNDLNGSFKKDNATPDTKFDTAEERNVIQNYENKAAAKLGEPIRQDHSASGTVPCSNPKCKK